MMENFNIHKFIDKAMAKKDRSVNIYISGKGDTSISVYPLDEKPKWIMTGDGNFYKCSNCGRISSEPTPHCRWCGELLTDMDVVNEQTVDLDPNCAGKKPVDISKSISDPNPDKWLSVTCDGGMKDE